MADSLELARARARAERERALSQPNFLERAGQSISDFFTGDDRIDPGDENVRELPDITIKPNDKAYGSTASRMGTAAEDTGKLGIVQNLLGDLPSRRDSSGNVIVSISPEKAAEISGRAFAPVEAGDYYLDRPGMSGQDFHDMIPELALGLMTGPLGRIASPVARTAAVAAGGAGESVASDLMAQAFGSTDPVSVKRAITSAIAAGGAEIVFSRLAGALVRKPKLVKDGKLTDEGRAVIDEMGLDLNEIGPGLEQRISEMVKQGVDPAAAARVVDAETLPVPVNLTRGQATGEAGAQMLESQAAEGALGSTAERIARGARDVQQEQLEANVAAIARDMGPDAADALPAAQRTLVGEREAAFKGVDEAYDAARAAKAGVPASPIQNGALDLADAVQNFNPRTAPEAFGFIDDFKGLADRAGDGVVPVKELEQWRSQLTNFAAGTSDRQQAAAAKAIRSRYDELTEQWTKDAILQGDDTALALWREAVSRRRDVGQMFEAGDIVEFMTKPGKDGEVPGPDELINRLFGATGFTPKKDLVKAFKTLRQRLPQDQYDAIRQEAWTRLVDRSRGARQFDGERALSGANMLRNIENLQRNYPDLWRTMFNSSERETIQKFARTLNRVTTSVPGGRNTSGTAAAISRQLQALWSAGVVREGGLRALAELPIIRAALSVKNTVQASRSFGKPLTRGPLPNVNLLNAGAMEATDDPDNVLNQALSVR